MDRFYTRPNLFNSLYRLGIGCCGTGIPIRKYFPKVIVIPKSAKLPDYFQEYRTNGPLMALVWLDKKPFYMVTTVHKPLASGEEQTKVTRRIKDGSCKLVPCPPCLPDYQHFMRGVDHGDQRIGYYNIGRRFRRWWKRVLRM